MSLWERLEAWRLAWFGPQADSELNTWLKGRSWYVRVPVLLFCLWQMFGWFGDADRHTIFFGLNLGIHEAGHLLTTGFGMIVSAAMGSGLQCLAPIAAAALFLRQRDFFALGLCLTWEASNLFYVAWYVNDAVKMEGQLLSVGGGDAYHDWNFLLDQFGMLGQEGWIANLIRLVAYACAIGGVLWSAWIMRRMALANP